MALLLMMFALVGMVLLASWHDSKPHVHDLAGAGHLIELGDHHPGDQPQPSDPMHVAAHIVLQGIAMPAEPVIATGIPALGFVWAIASSAAIRSIPPASILRPPRA